MGTDNIKPIRRNSGKGENFVRSKNPFAQGVQTTFAPNFDEVPLLGSALDSVLQCGCAVLMGRTRDGGAVVLTVLDGSERYRTYCSNSDERKAAIRFMAEQYAES